MGTLRFFEEVVSFKIRRTFGFADYKQHTHDTCPQANGRKGDDSRNSGR